MNTPTQLDFIQDLWDDLNITQLLEEHVPLPRRYLVDRLVRLIFPRDRGRLMQFVIDQSVLARRLALVATAAKTESTLESLSQVRLEARDCGALRLTANNLEYGLASEMEARVTEPGLVCLPARPFLSLVSALEGEVTIHTDPNCYARITAGRSRSRMPGQEANDFTELPVMPVSAVVSAETLVRLLSRVSFAVARGESLSRVEVPAALVRFTGDTLVCVATDGRRLALAQAPLVAGSPLEFLFPSEAMNHVKKLIEDRERACVAADAQHLFVAAGSRLLAARQLAGSFRYPAHPAEVRHAAGGDRFRRTALRDCSCLAVYRQRPPPRP